MMMIPTAKTTGRATSMRRRADLLEVRRAAVALPALVQHADDVLDHDDRAVDDEPEVDGAEAHQVAREPALPHRR